MTETLLEAVLSEGCLVLGRFGVEHGPEILGRSETVGAAGCRLGPDPGDGNCRAPAFSRVDGLKIETFVV